MKKSGFSCEGFCYHLGNKTEVNQLKIVKDHILLLHDLLVLGCLPIWRSTLNEAAFIWCQGSLQISMFVTYFHFHW